MPIATEQEQEPQFCDNCGDQVPTRDDEGHGPCCHDLPHPWHCGPDGLYNRLSATEDAEEEDEDEEPQRPTCPHCGGLEWRLTMSQTITDVDYMSGETIYYDPCDFDTPEATCGSCGMGAPGYLRLEEN